MWFRGLLVAVALLFAVPRAAAARSVEDRLEDRLPKSPVACLAEALSYEALHDSMSTAGTDSLRVRVGIRWGRLLHRGEDLPGAIAVFEGAVADARPLGHAILLADTLEFLSRAYGQVGRYEDVLTKAGESLALLAEAGDRKRTSGVWSAVAASYNMLGRIPEASAANDSVIAVARAFGDDPDIAVASCRQANLLLNTGHCAEALAAGDSALAATVRAERSGKNVSPGIRFITLRDRAAALAMLGRDDEALAAAVEVVAEAERMKSERALRGANIRMAEVYHTLGRPADALPVLARLGVDRLVPEDPFFVPLLTIQASALLDLGHVAAADSTIEVALRAYRNRWSNTVDRETRLGLYENAGAVFGVSARSALIRGEPFRAWEALEWGSSTSLREAVTGSPAPVDLTSVQAVLATHHAALLQWSDSAWVRMPGVIVTGDTVVGAELEFSRRISDAMDWVRDRVIAGASVDEIRPALHSIAAALTFTTATLPPDIDRLFIVVPSAWADFPFELLPIERGGDLTTWGDAFAMSFVPNASALRYLSDRVPGSGMVVFADPDVNGYPVETELGLRGFTPTPLLEARAEADAIATPTARRWVGADATIAAFNDSATSAASILHLATHAVVWPVSPSRNHVVLADGPVTASSIEGRSFAADLVALSGCRTAAGHAFRGEGALGLERSFLLAGSRSVVASRWDVGDRAARLFMTAFYRSLRAGHPRDDAMRDARHELQSAGLPPRDFAAFRLSGVGHLPVAELVDTRPLGRTMAWLAVLLSLTAGGWWWRSSRA